MSESNLTSVIRPDTTGTSVIRHNRNICILQNENYLVSHELKQRTSLIKVVNLLLKVVVRGPVLQSAGQLSVPVMSCIK